MLLSPAYLFPQIGLLFKGLEEDPANLIQGIFSYMKFPEACWDEETTSGPQEIGKISSMPYLTLAQFITPKGFPKAEKRRKGNTVLPLLVKLECDI